MNSITELLARSTDGRSEDTDQLFSLMYDDLRRLAGKFLQNEPIRNRLSSSSLVHQAYMRMVDQSRINWQGKTHFFAIGATVMRRILVDHARKNRSLKRGGNWERRQLTDEVTFQLHKDDDVVALDDLLKTLVVLNPRQAKIVELRFFGGMTMREISAEVNLGLRTVEKEWAMARAWMRRELRSDDLAAEDDAAEALDEKTTSFKSADSDRVDAKATEVERVDSATQVANDSSESDEASESGGLQGG